MHWSVICSQGGWKGAWLDGNPGQNLLTIVLSESSHHCVGLFAINPPSLSLFLSGRFGGRHALVTLGVVAAAADCAILGSTVCPGAINDAADVVRSDCDSFAVFPGKLSLLPLRGPGDETRFRSLHCQRVHLMYPSAE